MIKPIPVFFKLVNRTAIVVTPRQAFNDWLAQFDPDDKNKDFQQNPDVYLLPDYEDMEDLKEWLSLNFDLIFTDQMNNWYTDESMWVQNRTFELFNEWFSWSLHTMVWDTVERAIHKR